MAGENRDKVLVEIEVKEIKLQEGEGIKLHYIFEKEFAELLRRKQEYPLKILREVTKEEVQSCKKFYDWIDSESSSYYDQKEEEDKDRKKENVLIKVEVGGIDLYYIFEKGFVEHLRRKQKYPIVILREATEKEKWKGAAVEAWLYDEAFHYYD